jgi:CHAT domain-containing protein
MKEAGKTRICIVPHGPLHYFPFHLLLNGDSPLAQDFLVTYLPNYRLVDSSIARRNRRPVGSPQDELRTPPVLAHRSELSAIGLDFAPGGPLNLSELYGEREARTIASLFNIEAVTGNNATEEAFLGALTNSRRVHLSTHGWHCIAAPSFQTVYFSPGTKSDGKLHAFELVGLDLRGLELVTLSACETALGRFDIRDNLRGLPASLLLAGVRTIVGTLWNTENRCARYFFRRFYQEIRTGASPGKAFALAQQHTRVLHPQFRDWGAFYLMGDYHNNHGTAEVDVQSTEQELAP